MIEEIRNKKPNWKRCVIVGAKIDQIKGQIERNWNFSGQLRLKLNKLKTTDSFVKHFQIKGSNKNF
jgi:hypothetical protein